DSGWSEPGSVPLLERLQPLDDPTDTLLGDPEERPASDRWADLPHDCPDVSVFGGAENPLLETTGRFVDHGERDALLDLRPADVAGRLDAEIRVDAVVHASPLAGLVVRVEPLSVLAASAVGGDEVLHHVRRSDAVAEGVDEDDRDLGSDIDPDLVGQTQRPDREPPCFDGLVDAFHRGALGEEVE